jgi:hypothetical protein
MRSVAPRPAYVAETFPLAVGPATVDVHYVQVLPQPVGSAALDDVYGMLSVDSLEKILAGLHLGLERNADVQHKAEVDRHDQPVNCGEIRHLGLLANIEPETPKPSSTIRRALESTGTFPKLRRDDPRGLVPREAIVGNKEVADDGQEECILNSDLVCQPAEKQRNHRTAHVSNGDHA